MRGNDMERKEFLLSWWSSFLIETPRLKYLHIVLGGDKRENSAVFSSSFTSKDTEQ
jgi:hypothetical protein